MPETTDLETFYSLLTNLEELPFQGLPLRELAAARHLPERGVYFFREPGETRASGPSSRVVRVGTHALTANSKSTLSSRLRAHRGSASGRGNHRGSIFRLHVGAALLARDGLSNPTWGVGSVKPSTLRESAAAQAEELALERRVTEYIGNMSVLWINVDDEPGEGCMRGVVERNAIALLSNRLSPTDLPSVAWLGRYSQRDLIRQSGLWNVRHVEERYDRRFLDLLKMAVQQTAKGRA